jgi:nucleotide-binding universal stress UspA family protein
MRILLAVDGSVSSDRATQFVASLDLPAGSLIRVVCVQQTHVDVLAMSWASMGETAAPETEDESDVRHQREAVQRAELTVRKPDVTVEGFLLRGRPASAIVDEAKAMAADVVVVGSRGHGTIATMVLGSTASEIVDHAPCPVLVARGTVLGSIAFADDGSGSARSAEAVLADWPIFVGLPISVVTVAETAVPVAAGFTPGLYDQVLASYTRSVSEALEADRPGRRPGFGDRAVCRGPGDRHDRHGYPRPHRPGAPHPGQRGAERPAPCPVLRARSPRGEGNLSPAPSPPLAGSPWPLAPSPPLAGSPWPLAPSPPLAGSPWPPRRRSPTRPCRRSAH